MPYACSAVLDCLMLGNFRPFRTLIQTDLLPVILGVAGVFIGLKLLQLAIRKVRASVE